MRDSKRVWGDSPTDKARINRETSHYCALRNKVKVEHFGILFFRNDFKNTEHCETPHTDAPDQIDGENQESLGRNDDEFNRVCAIIYGRFINQTKDPTQFQFQL